jgi:tetratricopeptide (TPR) repeat protein
LNIEKNINNLQKLADKKNFSEIEDLCLKMIIKYEQSFLYYFLGMAQVNLNKIDSGVYFLKKSIFLNPNVAQAYNLLGKVYKNLGMNDLSKENFLKCIDLGLINEGIYTDYIEVLILLDRKDECKQVIEDALIKLPNSKEIKNIKERFV